MSRRSLVVPFVAAVALALAACGGSPDEPVSQPQDPTSDSGLPTAGGDPASGGTRLALPPRRDVHEDARDVSPRAFEMALYDETDDSFHLIYTTGVEPCYVLGAIEVVEESEQVTVTLLEGWLPDENGEQPVCIEIAEQVSTPVPLEAPLDGRAVIDGATGEPVPVDVITAEDAASS